MRILLIKTSSMGDIIHTFPALTDAAVAIPDISFDWVVEEPFAQIPLWHERVNKVIPVALRRWRKHLMASNTRHEFARMRAHLQEQPYDLVLDAQGLVKSAFVAYFARGTRAGLDWDSARESFASLVYQRKCKVNFYQHAVVRMRSLFSLALGYTLPTTPPDFNIKIPPIHAIADQDKYIVFLHGTSWESKQWPESYWRELAALIAKAGLKIKISGANQEEVARAQRIAEGQVDVEVLPNLNIPAMAALLANAKGAVAMDTGLGHLSAALAVPTVSIYGPTNEKYTGALGKSSILLSANFPCAPCLNRHCTYQQAATVTPACYKTVPPTRVWQALKDVCRLA